MSDEKLLSDARDKFERAADREDHNRKAGLDDLKFAKLLEQWPENIRRQREQEGRPCLTIDRLNPFIRQVVNDARQNKPSIKVHPADSSADPETAEIIDGLIRNIEVVSDADVAYDTAVENAVTVGFGYIRINTAFTSDDTFDQDIVIERVANPFSVYGDPDAESADGSDWNCAFVVTTMTKEEFERKYKGAEPVDWEGEGYQGLEAPWLDDDTVMVAEYWRRDPIERQIVMIDTGEVVDAAKVPEGATVVGKPRTVRSHKVTQYVMTGAEVLETVEWEGKYIPIVPVYGEEVNVEGKRYFKSLISNAKDSQRAFNYWKTAATELVALAPKAPFIGEEGAFDADPEKWATANNTSHAFIQYARTKQPPQRQQTSAQAVGEMQMALAANDDIKGTLGIYDASLGQRSNETSGRAIAARQREGDTATFHFIDNLTRAIRQVGRIVIDLIPKVYSTDRVVRVLGQDLKPSTAPVAPGGGMQQDDAGNVIGRIYDLTAGKYDLVVKAGPNYSTQREETRAELIEIIRSVPESAQILGPMYLRQSDWPGAEEAADRLEGKNPEEEMVPKAEAMQVIQQGAQQMQALQQQVADLQSQLGNKQAENELKGREIEVKGLEAQADLIRAQAEMRAALNPQPITPMGPA